MATTTVHWCTLENHQPDGCTLQTHPAVRVNGELSDFFTFFTRVCQGCVLAPAMDWLLGHTVSSTVPGVSIGLDYFTDLDCAGDVALLVVLLDLLEPALLNFCDEASKLSLQNCCSVPE